MAPTEKSPEGPHQGMAVWLLPALGTSLPSQSLQRISNPPTPPPKPPARLGEEFAHDSLGKSNTCVVFLGPQ